MGCCKFQSNLVSNFGAIAISKTSKTTNLYSDYIEKNIKGAHLINYNLCHKCKGHRVGIPSLLIKHA